MSVLKSLLPSDSPMEKGLYERCVKRAIDVFLSGLSLIVLSPVLVLIACLVRVKLGSPVIFVQERAGMIDPDTGAERIFRLYKFRSMSDRCDKSGQLLPDDMRITRFGRILRATSLDELPELWNILKGDMSIVGPRPLLVEYLPYYSESERVRHAVRPGLTGLAQVNGRNNLRWVEKFAFDVEYVNGISFLGDCQIVLKTVGKVLRKTDVLVGSEHAEGRLDVARSPVLRCIELPCGDVVRVRWMDRSEECKLAQLMRRISGDYPIPLDEKIEFFPYARKVLTYGQVLGEYVGDDLIGTAVGYMNDFDNNRAALALLGVEESYRSEGIGSALLDLYEREAVARGLVNLSLETHPTNRGAIRLYERRGYRSLGEMESGNICFVKRMATES